VESRNIKTKIGFAAAYDVNQVFEYEHNVRAFRGAGFRVETIATGDYSACVKSLIEECDSANPQILVDISTLDRLRLAKLLSAALVASPERDLSINFVYSLAAFSAPVPQENPNSHVGPVIDEFAGWWEEPDRVLSAIVGLGYEQDKALGAVEYLQAQDVWLFTPTSQVVQYTPALKQANISLLQMTPPEQQLTYDVGDPLDCVARLQSLTRGLRTRSNIVLLPFGPKLFSLCCLLVAASDRQIAVWRVSAQQADEPIDKRASGHIHGLRVTLKRLTEDDGSEARD
jgi:hypothetical protein